MLSRTTAEEDDRRSDILWSSQSPVGVSLGQVLDSTAQLHQAVRHLRREETRSNVVDQDTLWAKLKSEVTSQMEDGGLGGGVAVSTLLAQCSDTNTSDGTGDDYARGRFDRSSLAKHWSESVDVLLAHNSNMFSLGCVVDILLCTNKHTLDVQVHDLLESILRVVVELCSPCCTCVGKQDIDLVCVLPHLLDQSLNLTGLRNVGGNGDGFAVAGKGVQGGACLLAGLLFTGCDEDLGAAGLSESTICVRNATDASCVRRHTRMLREDQVRENHL